MTNDRFIFRAWDKKVEKMYYVEWLRYRGDYLDMLCVEELCFGYEQDTRINTTNTAELMQSTGLKDKNGKLIFEGDIIHLRSPCDEGNYEIDIIDCALRFKVGKKLYYDSRIFSDKSTTIEVIGNIYENKELLEVKK